MTRLHRAGPRTLTAALGTLATLAGGAGAQDDEPAKKVPPQYAMQYGPALAGTIRAPHPVDNVALKGVAIRLGTDGDAGMLFDTELLRWSAGWTGGFLKLRGTPYDGAHGPVPELAGEQVFGTRVVPGWSRAKTFADPRDIPHGPLPREWGRYRGLYVHGDQVIVAYDVAGCSILESPGIETAGELRMLTRNLQIDAHAVPLRLLVAQRAGAVMKVGHNAAIAWLEEDGEGDEKMVTAARAYPAHGVPASYFAWRTDGDGRLALEVDASRGTGGIKLAVWRGSASQLPAFEQIELHGATELAPLTRGGAPRWTEPVTTAGVVGTGDGGYVVDTITVPYDNPWKSRMRIAALDFFSDGRAAVSTWNGDVWTVSGIDDDLEELTWKRFAAGLFDPLGLKIVDDVVHTLGRDQITRLHDLNGDGEADHYECFNNDVMITKNFHEFAFDLQTDPEGNFYFSKGGPVRPGGRGFDKIVPHHGCILKVSKDGSSLSVYATGLRAPNGIGVGPDGRVTSGDNEGTWTPRCRLNWMQQGTFCGCPDTSHRDPRPETYDLPVCWMPMEVDNSSGGQVWVTSEKWGPFQGDLLHLSYGTCSLFKVLLQEVDGVTQGGVVRFPLSFASSCMRGRFHPIDGQLYVCGLKGWQTSAAKLSAVHRVRRTNSPARMPSGLEVFGNGIQLTFTEPLDRELATDVESYAIEQWNYVWSERYGSPEVAPSNEAKDIELAQDQWNKFKHHDPVQVASARLSEDGKHVFLEIAGLKPVMQMRIRYDLDAADGGAVRGEIHNSIHVVPEARGPSAGN